MRISRLASSLALLSLTSACVVYKSSDRDDFNSHGKERAPIASKPTPECVLTTDLSANDTIITTESGRLAQMADGSIHPLCQSEPSTL